MGEARNRGTYEQRRTAAIDALVNRTARIPTVWPRDHGKSRANQHLAEILSIAAGVSIVAELGERT